MKNIVIVGGGTFNHIRNHLALAAPAFGGTARAINKLVEQHLHKTPFGQYRHDLYLTKMARHDSDIVTNADVEQLVDQLIADPDTKVIFFNVALTDFTGQIDGVESGKYAERLKSREGPFAIDLTVADKLIGIIRKQRKDIFLVAFKTTAGATEDEQYIAGLNLLKENSVNLVLANDTVTRTNMIICPEEARYCVTTDRTTALTELVEMTMLRSQLTYTRSTVLPGSSIDWSSDVVPQSLRTVVEHCIEQGAYKTFRGVTAGHFAVKIGDNAFLTSKRKSNFNELKKIGLVHVEAFDNDNVVAIGAKPSVGGQSQRIVFRDHPDLDCIVHFHSPLNDNIVAFPTKSQREFECGSHECGMNTSSGLREIQDGIWAVYLDQHGPNIVFNSNIDPQLVIDFIDYYFVLAAKTGGAVMLEAKLG